MEPYHDGAGPGGEAARPGGAGLKPDKDFTEILAYAHKLRLAGASKDNALKQPLAFARKLREG